MDGMVLKIDRCSKHDGPGIRTVVFLKGCPLRCRWCSTPDSQSMEPHLIHTETLCARCGRCVAHCPEKALDMGAGGHCRRPQALYPLRQMRRIVPQERHEGDRDQNER